MTETIEALFDGQVFRPNKPVQLKPNTRVRMVIETMSPVEDQSASFLRTAKALNLQGPPDWSVNIDDYLYGIKSSDEK